MHRGIGYSEVFQQTLTGKSAYQLSIACYDGAKGIIDLVNQAGAKLEGMGFLIEKGFQNGGDDLRGKGIHVESLAIIDSLDDCTIKLR